MDEKTLVRRAKSGDIDAYQALVRCHRETAFRVAVLIAGNTADAQDAANDAVVKAFYALARFRSEPPFRPWLLRIVANEAATGIAARPGPRRPVALLAPHPLETSLTAPCPRPSGSHPARAVRGRPAGALRLSHPLDR